MDAIVADSFGRLHDIFDVALRIKAFSEFIEIMNRTLFLWASDVRISGESGKSMAVAGAVVLN